MSPDTGLAKQRAEVRQRVKHPPRQDPPFRTNILGTTTEPLGCLLPASYEETEGSLKLLKVPRLGPKYLASEFDMTRLEHPFVRKWLWAAGRRALPRPLHFQRLLGRAVIIVERLDMHLVWGPGRLFLKPIPRFLLVPKFWRDHLGCLGTGDCWKMPDASSSEEQCGHNVIRRNALGFLLSYVPLIRFESDFILAKECNLLPYELQWSQWKQLSEELLDNESSTDPVAERWEYGELRLNRLNKICWFRRLYRGAYLTKWNQYNDFWSDNIAWIGPTTVYIVVALTAMQVGLATDILNDNAAFQRVSYGLTIFSLIGLPGCLGPLALYLVIVVIKNARWAWNQEKAARKPREREADQRV